MTKAKTNNKETKLQKQDILQQVFDINDNMRQMKYPDLMPIYPLKNKICLFESGKVDISSGSKSVRKEKTLKVYLLEDRAYVSKYYVLQVKSDVYINGAYDLDLSETKTISIPRLLLSILELAKMYKVTEIGSRILNDNIIKILTCCYDLGESSASYLSRISVKAQPTGASIGVLSESMRGLALREYNPCFLIKDFEKFKKAVISLLSCLIEKRCVEY